MPGIRENAAHTWKWLIYLSYWYLNDSTKVSIPGVTFPDTPAAVKPHYTHLLGISVTAGVHKSLTPANKLSPECIYLQKVIQITQLQVYHGRRNMCEQLIPPTTFVIITNQKCQLYLKVRPRRHGTLCKHYINPLNFFFCNGLSMWRYAKRLK